MTSHLELCGNSGIRRLIELAFGPDVAVTGQRDVAGGRGTFSDVYQLTLSDQPRGDRQPARSGPPPSVVAKLPTGNDNREAAKLGGAYRREATAYRSLLPDSPVRTPDVYAVAEADGLAAFLLEDLTPLRHVDQIDGLDPGDAIAVAQALARFHDWWRRRLRDPGNAADGAGIRRSTVSGFKLESLNAGLQALRHRWSEVGDDQTQAFADVVAKADHLIDLFGAAATDPVESTAGFTLCHGDPRADNLAFEDDGRPVLFDWQQLAIQFGEADLAWLGATSLEPVVRRRVDQRLVEAYGGSIDRYRLGLILPGLAALYLAQRQADHHRTRRFISISLERIGTALVDYEVAKLV
jgi:hypothetical protein